MPTCSTIPKSILLVIVAVILWQCVSSSNSPSTLSVITPDPGRNGIAEIVLAGNLDEFSVPIQVDISDGEGIDTVALLIENAQGEVVWEAQPLLQAPFHWEWEARYLPNGDYKAVFAITDSEGEVIVRTLQLDLLTRYELQFINYTTREATLFIGGNTLVMPADTSLASIVVDGGNREISINLKDWPPYPYFDAEIINIRRNSVLELYMTASEDDFYYLLRP